MTVENASVVRQVVKHTANNKRHDCVENGAHDEQNSNLLAAFDNLAGHTSQSAF